MRVGILILVATMGLLGVPLDGALAGDSCPPCCEKVSEAPCEDGKTCGVGKSGDGDCLCSSNSAYTVGFKRTHDIDRSDKKHCDAPTPLIDKKIPSPR